MSRKRSNTATTLVAGQKITTTTWTHDLKFHDGNVVINLNCWIGLAKGDLIQVTRANTFAKPGSGFMFLVDDSSIAGPKSSVQHLSILREIANKFKFTQNGDVVLTKIDPAEVEASVIEVYFRDMYLGRRDMWRMISSYTGRPVYAEQKLALFGSTTAAIKKIYVNERPVLSALVTPKTRTVFRSLSARSNIFICVCRELWEFAEDGERYYEKVVHSFLPTLIKKWQQNNVKHVVAIVLFSRVYYDQSELGFAAGPLIQDEEGVSYKDFYKVVTDLEILDDWRPTLVNLKSAFLEFHRDILFNHHFHQNEERPEYQGQSDSLRRLVGRLAYAHDSPILEAINLGLNPTDLHYVDRSLSLTGCSTVVITPGPGHFRVSKDLLQFTTMRLLDQGFGVDLVCLTKAPLHVSPLFSFTSDDPNIVSQAGHIATRGTSDTDSLARPGTVGDTKMHHWEPFWLYVSWWDIQADMPFRPDRFVPRAKMREIQTLGLIDHDMAAAIEIEYMDDPAEGVEAKGPLSLYEARLLARDAFDKSVFAAPPAPTAVRPAIVLEELPVRAAPPVPPPVQSVVTSKTERPRPRHIRRPSETHDSNRPEVVGTGEGSIGKSSSRGGDDRSRSRTVDTTSSGQNRSASRDSTRSAVSVASSLRPKPSSRFTSSWLFGGFRSASASSQTPTPLSTTTTTAVERDTRSESGEVPESPVDPLAATMISSFHFNGDPPKSSVPAEPIAIRSSAASERPAAAVGEEWIPPLPKPRTKLSTHPVFNPSRPNTLLRSNNALARVWQHVFHGPTFTSDVKWTSMYAPACLPLTTENYPTETEIQRDYVDYTFDVYLTKDAKSSFMLKKDAHRDPAQVDWAKLALREMIAARLIQGFQLIVRSDSNHEVFNPNDEDTAKMRPAAFPVGIFDVLPTTAYPVYLSLGSQVHRLLYDPIEDVIRISRFVRRDAKRSDRVIPYGCLVWPKLGTGYTEARTKFSLPDFDAYGWNRLDRTITGHQKDFGDLVRFWRTRYLVIPSEERPIERRADAGFGEILSDEECRLMGITRLADLFHKARWLGPDDSLDQFAVPQFLPTTLDPSASVLDDDLMAQLDQSNATAATGKPRLSDKELEGMSLLNVAQAMREEHGLIQDNQWHGNVYPDSFTGQSWVTWAVRAFRDVSTREEAENMGARFLKEGLFAHVRREHAFMDGHYYYQLSGQYAPPPRTTSPSLSKWFQPRRSSLREPRSPETPTLASSILGTGSAGGLRPKKRHSLSQTIIIDADHRKRSTQAETLILHHDVIQNPATAFHFEFNWIGTAGRCIHDLLQHWSHIVEQYGLKLVEGYVDPIVNVTDKNVFQSCFPICLAVAPPVLPDLQDRLPLGASYKYYFQYAILRKFGYILDIEAEQSYVESVDVYYSYRRASFRQSQFVHRSGRAFAQVMPGAEGFRWMTNRLLAASTAFPVGGPGGKGEKTPHEKAADLRIQLLEFCSSAEQLQAFYEEVTAMLPPVIGIAADLEIREIKEGVSS